MYTGGGQEELSGRNPPQEEAQEGPRTTGQPDAQKQVPGGHRALGLLLAAVPKESIPLMLVSLSLYDLAVELHLHLDLSSLDIFSGMVKHMDLCAQNQ